MKEGNLWDDEVVEECIDEWDLGVEDEWVEDGLVIGKGE